MNLKGKKYENLFHGQKIDMLLVQNGCSKIKLIVIGQSQRIKQCWFP